MNQVVIIFLIAIGLALLGGILWYLLWLTEGMYLGWRVVALLYDLYAGRYDRAKRYDHVYETFCLARPILSRLRQDSVTAPLVLDVATGTGRLPHVLLEQDDFHGRVIGLDISRQMLFHAAVKLFGHARCHLIWHTVAALPFFDDTFDLVTCLEAWEFFPHAREDLRELARVLRPGGIMLISNRTGPDSRVMPGKTLDTASLQRWLTDELGLIEVTCARWQVDYDLIWARKTGASLPSGPRPLAENLRCPACEDGNLVPSADETAWACTTCGQRVSTGEDGVIELLPLYGRQPQRASAPSSARSE